MNKYDFNDILDRRNNGSMKWERPYIKKRFQTDLKDGDKMFPMFIADMDFRLPEEIMEPVRQRYYYPDLGYFHVQDSFYQSIVHWYKNIHGIELQTEWILPSVGTISSLHLACDALVRGQNILTMTPVYGPFKNCCHIGNMFTCPLLLNENRYDIDFESLEQSFEVNRINAILICNPHNPGGRCWSREELQRLVDLCRKYEVYILSDEIHADLQISENRFTSLIEFHDQYNRIIVSASPNKTFSISGLSTSYILCADAQIREIYTDYMNHLHLNSNRLGIEMIEMVYNYGQDWCLQLQKVIRSNTDLVVKTMEELNITVMKPDAGFLVWIHMDDSVDADQFILDLAQKYHVFLETGSRFVEHYEGWIRINVGTAPKLVEEAMNRFRQMFLEY